MKKTRPLMFTCVGAGLSALGVAIFLATFEPHGGVNPSDILFPLLGPVVALLGIKGDVPVFLFYGLVLVHWPILGEVVDAVRWVRRNRESRRVSA